MSKVIEKVRELNKEFDDDRANKRQSFISFKNKELEALLEAERVLGKSKARVIAIACLVLSELVRKEKDEK